MMRDGSERISANVRCLRAPIGTAVRAENRNDRLSPCITAKDETELWYITLFSCSRGRNLTTNHDGGRDAKAKRHTDRGCRARWRRSFVRGLYGHDESCSDQRDQRSEASVNRCKSPRHHAAVLLYCQRFGGSGV